ncbi:MAG: T9SS type A sorting domain-containing protein [Bacteroidota bacterium]
MKKLITLSLCLLLFNATYAQLSNLDFENWDTNPSSLKLYPKDWLLMKDSYCKQSAKAQSGNYALMVSVWYYYVKTNVIRREAISEKPMALSGYYTYTDNVVKSLSASEPISDTALVKVYLTHWDNVFKRNDTVGQGNLFLFQSSEYSYFSCPIHYSSTVTPDSVSIIFDPSIVRRYEDGTYFQSISPSGESSFLTIDNLSLESSSKIEESEVRMEISVFPNPTFDYLNIAYKDNEPLSCVITDIVGSVCLSTELKTSRSHLNLTALPSGVYLLKITNANSKLIYYCQLVKI